MNNYNSQIGQKTTNKQSNMHFEIVNEGGRAKYLISPTTPTHPPTQHNFNLLKNMKSEFQKFSILAYNRRPSNSIIMDKNKGRYKFLFHMFIDYYHRVQSRFSHAFCFPRNEPQPLRYI